MPKNIATTMLTTITPSVYWIVCSRVGQRTFLSSVRASCKNVVILFAISVGFRD